MTVGAHLARITRPYDPATPPEGVRLDLSSTAAALGVSQAELAAAADISRTALWQIAANNTWPAKTDPAAIKADLHDLLLARGATPEQLDTLFHAHVKRRAAKTPGPADAAAPPPNPKETDVLLPKQTLSMDARKAFRLFANPFDTEVQSAEEMFENAEIRFVREACWQAAIGGRFVALVSESGGGKTTIVQDLEERIERDHKRVRLIRPHVLGMEDSDRKGRQLKSNDILAAIITTLDPLASVPVTLEARSRKAAKALTGAIEAGFQHLLVIEEAHCLPDATLKHLKRLHELHLGRRPMLGILLVAQPELLNKLDPAKASLREVTQRCEVVQLMPLDADLKAYLAHRAKAADRRVEEFITDDGIEAIRVRLTAELTQRNGKRKAVSLAYPLAVNNVFTAALNEAAAIGAPLINRDVVRKV